MNQKRFILIASLIALIALLIFVWFTMQQTGLTDKLFPSPTPEPIITPAPTPEPTPVPTEAPIAYARIRAAGDIIIDTPMLNSAYSGGQYKFGKYFSQIKEALSDADLTIANIEGAIAGSDALGYAGYPSFNTPASILETLKDCGVDMLTLANNHSLDRYFDGLMNTLRNVDQAGLMRTGAYRSKKEYAKPLVVDVNGIKIGFTNYTTGFNNNDKHSDKRATEYGVRHVNGANFKKDIAALREAGAQAVVVFMHWDVEYQLSPSDKTLEYAMQLADAGADVIIGGHPHHVQPIEWIDGADGHRALCLFSMGNFLSNHKGAYLDNGIIFEVGFALRADGKVHVVDPKYLPVWVWVYEQGDGHNYQVMPVRKTIDNRPEDMTDERYERVQAAWQESLGVLGSKIAQPIG